MYPRVIKANEMSVINKVDPDKEVELFIDEIVGGYSKDCANVDFVAVFLGPFTIRMTIQDAINLKRILNASINELIK